MRTTKEQQRYFEEEQRRAMRDAAAKRTPRNVRDGTLAILLSITAVAACVSRTASSGGERAGAGEVAPALVVERFLHAANAAAQLRSRRGASPEGMRGALEVMARLFGTREGAILELYPRDEVEKRMDLLANILRHDDYSVESELGVPGRTSEAVEVMVRVRMGAREASIPFTVVRTRKGAWLVELVDVERILNPRVP
ncbi:MAG: hypothetical protein HY704_16195 [Gemmatimonadetes bacterium]|nr:hypothetical protein [Gemmatimonadota bacterium]